MTHGIQDFDAFVAKFDACSDFAYTKINHGFWEGLADAYATVGRPVPPTRVRDADRAAQRPFFFEGGFVETFLALLEQAGRDADPHLFCGMELSAWPGDNRIIGTPFHPERSVPVLEAYRRLLDDSTDGLLLKRAVMDGSILSLFERLRPMRVIVVGPDAVAPLAGALRLEDARYLPIHPQQARRSRNDTEAALRALLDEPSDRPTCVLLQAGTLAPYWLLRVRPDYPEVRFIDGGLAFSIAEPADLLSRPWGKVYREQILATYASLPGIVSGARHAPVARLDYLGVAGRAPEPTGRQSHSSGHPARVALVEHKPVDSVRMHAFLEPATQAPTTQAPASRAVQESGFGPAAEMLAYGYRRYMGQSGARALVPCASAGAALDVLAGVHACKLGRGMRWAVSALGFTRLGAGAFADAQVVDVDARGMLSLEALKALPADGYDGIVVSNPFGLRSGFEAHARFAAAHGKVMLLDNPAGIGPSIPEQPYQALSLHDAVPYGSGEGGLLLAPSEDAELCRALAGYVPLDPALAGYRVADAKLSEQACARQLQRLEAAPTWVPLYEMQSVRMQHVVARAGLRPLLAGQGAVVSASLPLLVPQPPTEEVLGNPLFELAKLRAPLGPGRVAGLLHAHLVEVPCHPGMRAVDTDDIVSGLRRLVQQAKAA